MRRNYGFFCVLPGALVITAAFLVGGKYPMFGAIKRFPVLNLYLIDLGDSLKFLTSEQVTDKRSQIVASLINEGSTEAKDLICSLDYWGLTLASSIKPQAYGNKNSLWAMACLRPLPEFDPSATTELVKALKSSDSEIRRLSAWLLGMKAQRAHRNSTISRALLPVLNDPDEWTRAMAAWALSQVGSLGAPSVYELAKKFENDSSPWLRRDLARALTNEKQRPQVHKILEKARSDRDGIVQTIAKSALDESPQIKPGKPASRDERTKLKWYFDDPNLTLDHYNAEIYCRKQGLRLPTRDEWAQAERSGIRDSVQTLRNHWSWSSVLPSNPHVAFAFYGNNGVISYGFRDDDEGAVVCVGGG